VFQLEGKTTEQLLTELYSKKKLKLQKLLDLTLQQSEVIKQLDMDGLTELLSKRQSLMDEIDRTDREIDRAKGQLPAPFADRSRVPLLMELQAEINELLKTIITHDDENNAALKHAFADVKQKLSNLKDGKTIRQAYAPMKQPQNFGYFIDKKK